MDWNTIIIASITGAFPTIGLIANQVLSSRNKLKDSKVIAKLEIYKENMKSRFNLYQSIISTSRDLGVKFSTCIYVFEAHKDKNSKIIHDAVEYVSMDRFYKIFFLDYYNKYISIEKNNITYTSKDSYPLIKDLTEKIHDLRRFLSTIALNRFDVTKEAKIKSVEFRNEFETTLSKLLDSIMNESVSLTDNL